MKNYTVIKINKYGDIGRATIWLKGAQNKTRRHKRRGRKNGIVWARDCRYEMIMARVPFAEADHYRVGDTAKFRAADTLLGLDKVRLVAKGAANGKR